MKKSLKEKFIALNGKRVKVTSTYGATITGILTAGTYQTSNRCVGGYFGYTVDGEIKQGIVSATGKYSFSLKDTLDVEEVK